MRFDCLILTLWVRWDVNGRKIGRLRKFRLFRCLKAFSNVCLFLRPVREKLSDLNRSAVRKRLPTPGVEQRWPQMKRKPSASDTGRLPFCSVIGVQSLT